MKGFACLALCVLAATASATLRREEALAALDKMADSYNCTKQKVAIGSTVDELDGKVTAKAAALEKHCVDEAASIKETLEAEKAMAAAELVVARRNATAALEEGMQRVMETFIEEKSELEEAVANATNAERAKRHAFEDARGEANEARANMAMTKLSSGKAMEGAEVDLISSKNLSREMFNTLSANSGAANAIAERLAKTEQDVALKHCALDQKAELAAQAKEQVIVDKVEELIEKLSLCKSEGPEKTGAVQAVDSAEKKAAFDPEKAEDRKGALSATSGEPRDAKKEAVLKVAEKKKLTAAAAAAAAAVAVGLGAADVDAGTDAATVVKKLKEAPTATALLEIEGGKAGHSAMCRAAAARLRYLYVGKMNGTMANLKELKANLKVKRSASDNRFSACGAKANANYEKVAKEAAAHMAADFVSFQTNLDEKLNRAEDEHNATVTAALAAQEMAVNKASARGADEQVTRGESEIASAKLDTVRVACHAWVRRVLVFVAGLVVCEEGRGKLKKWSARGETGKGTTK
jgi:hypothetical protein